MAFTGLFLDNNIKVTLTPLPKFRLILAGYKKQKLIAADQVKVIILIKLR